MFIQKEYTGTKGGYVSQNTMCAIPGVTNTVSLNKFLTDLYGGLLTEFLRDECGADVRYDAEKAWTWINGVPYMFAVENSPAAAGCYIVSLYIPFCTANNKVYTAGFPSTTTGTVYAHGTFYYNTQTGAYSAAFRLVGDAGTAFALLLPYYASRSRTSASASWVNKVLTSPGGFSVIVLFFRGKDLMREREARFIAGGTNNNVFIHEIDGAGNYCDIGFSDVNCPFGKAVIETREREAQDVPNRLLLVKVRIEFFELQDCYMYPENLGLPKGQPMTGESAVFVTIGGERYWIAYAGTGFSAFGLVRCPTPD